MKQMIYKEASEGLEWLERLGEVLGFEIVGDIGREKKRK